MTRVQSKQYGSPPSRNVYGGPIRIARSPLRGLARRYQIDRGDLLARAAQQMRDLMQADAVA